MSENYYVNSDEVKDFVKKLFDKTGTELSAIITRYISYRSEAVQAALYVSVEKGLMPYDLKEALWQQIESSFKAHENNIKYNRWESSNAFIQYFSGYQDEEIYEIIEDPNDITIDVYHALLVTARDRELISGQDFNRYYGEAKLAVTNDAEINRSILTDLFRMEEIKEDPEEIVDYEAEKEKYWKCPNCNENVGMEYAICWNCQAAIPEMIQHPAPAEMRKEISAKVPPSLAKIGFRLIGTGVFVFALDYFRHYRHSSYLATHLGGYILSGLFVLVGIGFLVYGAVADKNMV
jgi:hypothetical protein